MGANLDPFDIEALEKSLNDSAVRVSTIWVSFLVFGLYLVIAAETITDEQLFLANSIKLPVLGVDLPLIGFFYVAPMLFVLFHGYVLIQVLLLSRTASAYNEAVEHSVMVASDRARIRQRLANTLFAQIFAGSPQEREGLLGTLLRFMAQVSLAIGPILVLLRYQVIFLPYQDFWVTFTHRSLIAIDLAMVLVLWRGVLGSPRVIGWRASAKQYGLAAAIGAVFYGSLAEHFPGEPHAKLIRWIRFYDDDGDECRRAYHLRLQHVRVVDYEKLAKIDGETKVKGLRAYDGERTRSFRKRHFRCADFYRADLQRADFTWADLRRANLASAQLQGTVLRSTDLEGANLARAHMQGADLSLVREWQGYNPTRKEIIIRQAHNGANLAGALLMHAQLQGALLYRAQMQGADLEGAQMQGANLTEANLVGANLRQASMQTADLSRADLRAADLRRAQMQGTNLFEAHLEGARFNQGALTLAQFRRAFLWRASGADCHDAQVTEPRLDPIPDEQATLIDEVVSKVPEPNQGGLRERLVTDAKNEHTNDAWRACETKALPEADYERKHADYLVRLACDTNKYDFMYLVHGIYTNWIGYADESLPLPFGPLSRSHQRAIAGGLVAGDCRGATELGDRIIERLRDIDREPPR